MELRDLVKAGARTERAGREVQVDQEVAENRLGSTTAAFDLALLETFHSEVPAWWPGCSSWQTPHGSCSKNHLFGRDSVGPKAKMKIPRWGLQGSVLEVTKMVAGWSV